jgi:hypothetical protein
VNPQATDPATTPGAGRPLPRLAAARRPAGLALLRWLEDESAPRLCLVSGGADRGATQLLAWLAQAGTDGRAPAAQAVHAVLPLEGLTLDAAVWLLAEQLALPARTPAELFAAVREDGRRTVLCFAELDRAGGVALPDQPRRIVSELLDPLLGFCPQVRLVVDTARMPLANDFLSLTHPAVIDLDDPRWSTESAAGPAPQQDGGDPAGRWWRTVPPEARNALRVLACAPRGLTVAQWEFLAGSGGPGGARDVASACAVLSPPLGDRYRLDAAQAAHTLMSGEEELGQDLLVAHERATALGLLAAAIPRRQGAPDLAAADAGLLTLLLEYAVLLGRAEELLADARFLVHADPVAVTAAFAACAGGIDPAGAAAGHARAWHAAGPGLLVARGPSERAVLLRTRLLGRASAAEAKSAELLTEVCTQARWIPQWARWTPRAAVGAARAADGSLLQAETGGTVHVVDAADGTEIGRLVRPDGPVPLRDIAVRPTDGAVLLLDDFGALHTVTDDGTPSAEPSEPSEPGVSACVLTVVPDDGADVVAVGHLDGTVRIGHRSQVLHPAAVTALATALLPGAARPLLVSGGADGTVRLWNPLGPGTTPSDPVDAHSSPVTAVALCATAAGTQLACAWADGLLRLRLLDADDTVVELRPGSPVWALNPDPSGALLLSLPDGVVRLSAPTPAGNVVTPR